MGENHEPIIKEQCDCTGSVPACRQILSIRNRGQLSVDAVPADQRSMEPLEKLRCERGVVTVSAMGRLLLAVIFARYLAAVLIVVGIVWAIHWLNRIF